MQLNWPQYYFYLLILYLWFKLFILILSQDESNSDTLGVRDTGVKQSILLTECMGWVSTNPMGNLLQLSIETDQSLLQNNTANADTTKKVHRVQGRMNVKASRSYTAAFISNCYRYY